jgi:hypothetical protein
VVWLLLRKLSAYALSYEKQENLHPPPRKRAGVSMKRAGVSWEPLKVSMYRRFREILRFRAKFNIIRQSFFVFYRMSDIIFSKYLVKSKFYSFHEFLISKQEESCIH